MDTATKARLISAVTEYDRKQAKRSHHNIWALPQYMRAVDNAEVEMQGGAGLRSALLASFNGRLLDVCLRAVGLATSTRDEQGGW